MNRSYEIIQIIKLYNTSLVIKLITQNILLHANIRVGAYITLHARTREHTTITTRYSAIPQNPRFDGDVI